jgi:hypothetical protein
MKTFLAILALAGVALVVYAMAELAGHPAAGAANAFEDKILLIYLTPDPEIPAHTLKDVRIEKIWGRDFLVGIGADTKRESDWTIGRPFSVAIEHITALTAFTPDEFEKFCEETQDLEDEEMRLQPL